MYLGKTVAEWASARQELAESYMTDRPKDGTEALGVMTLWMSARAAEKMADGATQEQAVAETMEEVAELMGGRS